jgi:hypothetical protein
VCGKSLKEVFITLLAIFAPAIHKNLTNTIEKLLFDTKNIKKLLKPLFGMMDLDGNGTIDLFEANILALPFALASADNVTLKHMEARMNVDFLISVIYLIFDQDADGAISKDECVKRVSAYLCGIFKAVDAAIDIFVDVSIQAIPTCEDLIAL